MRPENPSLEQVLARLVQVNEAIDPQGEDGDEVWCGVRLQVYADGDGDNADKWWAIRVGDSSYDQDHRGAWGAASVPGRGRLTDSNAEEIAKDLLRQVEEAQDG